MIKLYKDDEDQPLTIEQIISLMQNELGEIIIPMKGELCDLGSWNRFIIKVQGAFRGFLYRSYIKDFDVICIRSQSDLIIECDFLDLKKGFLSLHLREGKLYADFNIH